MDRIIKRVIAVVLLGLIGNIIRELSILFVFLKSKTANHRHIKFLTETWRKYFWYSSSALGSPGKLRNAVWIFFVSLLPFWSATHQRIKYITKTCKKVFWYILSVFASRPPQAAARLPQTKDYNRYFNKVLTLKREDTKEVVKKVMPILEAILKEVHQQDPRFSSEPIKVGSYPQKLKIKRADEFDLNVPILFYNRHMTWSKDFW